MQITPKPAAVESVLHDAQKIVCYVIKGNQKASASALATNTPMTSIERKY
jgi:hypothetical protein